MLTANTENIGVGSQNKSIQRTMPVKTLQGVLVKKKDIFNGLKHNSRAFAGACVIEVGKSSQHL